MFTLSLSFFVLLYFKPLPRPPYPSSHILFCTPTSLSHSLSLFLSLSLSLSLSLPLLLGSMFSISKCLHRVALVSYRLSFMLIYLHSHLANDFSVLPLINLSIYLLRDYLYKYLQRFLINPSFLCHGSHTYLFFCYLDLLQSFNVC